MERGRRTDMTDWAMWVCNPLFCPYSEIFDYKIFVLT
jgi:hypothetical protein